MTIRGHPGASALLSRSIYTVSRELPSVSSAHALYTRTIQMIHVWTSYIFFNLIKQAEHKKNVCSTLQPQQPDCLLRHHHRRTGEFKFPANVESTSLLFTSLDLTWLSHVKLWNAAFLVCVKCVQITLIQFLCVFLQQLARARHTFSSSFSSAELNVAV